MASLTLSGGETSRGTKALLALLLLLGLLVVYVFVFHLEIDEKIERKKGETARLEQELNVRKGDEARYFADRDELQLREQKMREYNRILPADAEPAAFLSAIQTVANLSGVNLKGWQPIEEGKDQYFARVPMRLELTGRYHQLEKFVYELGRTDRIINVENLEIVEPKQEGEEVQLKARCLATTFHLLAAPSAPETAKVTP